MPSDSQRRWPSRRFLILTLGLCALASAVAWLRRPAPRVAARPYHFPTRELEELDRALQARLAIVPDNDFGIGRIGNRYGYFYPATPQEKSAVKNLQSARQQVVFYVVGRSAIRSEYGGQIYHVQPVQGPVYITPHSSVQVEPQKQYFNNQQTRFISVKGIPVDAPSDHELLNLSRWVFQNDNLRNGTDTKITKWNVVARPIAASAQECVDCHNMRAPSLPKNEIHFTLNRYGNRDLISLGDTVGIALYCYRNARTIRTRKLTDEELLAKPDQ